MRTDISDFRTENHRLLLIREEAKKREGRCETVGIKLKNL